MTRWTAKEILMTLISFIITIGVTYLALIMISVLQIHALIALFLIFFIPFVCGIGISYFLKKRDKHIRLCTVTLAVFDILLIALCMNLTFAATLCGKITGYYNLEAIGFFLFYAILFCTGLLSGFGFGFFVWKCKRK